MSPITIFSTDERRTRGQVDKKPQSPQSPKKTTGQDGGREAEAESPRADS